MFRVPRRDATCGMNDASHIAVYEKRSDKDVDGKLVWIHKPYGTSTSYMRPCSRITDSSLTVYNLPLADAERQNAESSFATMTENSFPETIPLCTGFEKKLTKNVSSTADSDGAFDFKCFCAK